MPKRVPKKVSITSEYPIYHVKLAIRDKYKLLLYETILFSVGVERQIDNICSSIVPRIRAMSPCWLLFVLLLVETEALKSYDIRNSTLGVVYYCKECDRACFRVFTGRNDTEWELRVCYYSRESSLSSFWGFYHKGNIQNLWKTNDSIIENRYQQFSVYMCGMEFWIIYLEK